MSKQIKQMEMDSLRRTFKDVRDLVVLSVDKLDCTTDSIMRTQLRKKQIRLQRVKNSLARRIFDDLGIKTDTWEGTTVLAWGGTSLAELSRDLEALVKKYDKMLKVKGAVSEGQGITFQAALAMPTRPQAIGRVVSLAMGPAQRLMSQILAPASSVVGQIKTLAERQPPEAAPAAEAGPAAEAALPAS
jgi:ribosomal protein L10